MEFISERSVTKILSAREIISGNNLITNISKNEYNLGGYLKNAKKMPSKYDERFIFIK